MARDTPAWQHIRWKPQPEDRFADAGTMRGTYFHQDLLIAQRIFEAEPRRHLDVGSRVDGFVAHVASFRRIEIVDIRPLRSTVPEISFLRADVMKPPIRRARPSATPSAAFTCSSTSVSVATAIPST